MSQRFTEGASMACRPAWSRPSLLVRPFHSQQSAGIAGRVLGFRFTQRGVVIVSAQLRRSGKAVAAVGSDIRAPQSHIKDDVLFQFSILLNPTFLLFTLFLVGIRAAAASQQHDSLPDQPPVMAVVSDARGTKQKNNLAQSTEDSSSKKYRAAVAENVGNEAATAEFGERVDEEKDMSKALNDWRAIPYKLTVPLRVVGLRGSVPPIWLKDFILSQGKRVRATFEYKGDLKEIVSALKAALETKQINHRSLLAADIVTIGDSWLPFAVSGGLIQPIENAEQQDWFKRLCPKWQAYLRRDQEGRYMPCGPVWGVPYRWGSMVIAFRKDKLLKSNIPLIKDWMDLWRPELKGKIAMVDAPREVVGAVLKSLGASYNTEDFDASVKGGKAAVKDRFFALQRQVKVFDSVHYLKALGSGDVWVAVGWSSDVIPVAKRMSNVRVVVPKSGASLWADLWAIPAATSVLTADKIGSRVCGASPLVQQWFNFCLQPARDLPFRKGVFVGASPLSLHGWARADLDEVEVLKSVSDTLIDHTNEDNLIGTENNPSGPPSDTNMVEGVPPEDCLEKCEFLEPLSDKGVADYEWLFSQAAKKVNARKWFLWQRTSEH